MPEKKDINPIDLTKIAQSIWKHKKIYLITLPIAFVLGCFYVLSIPRYYNCQVKLAPETANTNLGNLGSLASSVGIDITGKMGHNLDAISPELYPDLMSSIDFRVSLFPVQIKTQDNRFEDNYYTYLERHRKSPWWAVIRGKISEILKKEEKSTYNGEKKVSPFLLSKRQHDIAGIIGENVKCAVDKKTNVISIDVEDQDPLVAATIADSVSSRLQTFITNYRTQKARNDLAYVKGLYIEAKSLYEKARQKYGAYGDANMDLLLQSYKLKQEDLENDMQLRYNNYTALAMQYTAAQAKVQEKTPAFTTLQSASVPIKPTGPKRMIIVAFVLLLTFIGTSLYVFQKDA
ncbi:chain length determinant protein [Hallella bergensis DSM 17361]|uniref:Chain length determinant protein n=1 Tax=Hallella bergensis DSM 17361 TaxID=585502 RepID=D1PXM6_9BACT|nr:chain length determinant protein [Hallella bergensis]EFA43850.1 chain length determinant protein [Hallella bergensis DSM 17361]